MVLLIGLAWINFSGSSKSGQRIKELQAEIDDLQKQRAAAEAISNLPENHDVTVAEELLEQADQSPPAFLDAVVQ